MAANKFATMLHRNTHKITVILVYAVLEWILIILLLLNSLFSYLIGKFADYFGLKQPCLWCSRVDHVFEPGKKKNLYRDLVCDNHASEISKLGYCSNHRKLAVAQDMCEDCSSSRPNSHVKSIDIGKRIALFSWVKEMDMISNDGKKKIENGEKDLKCSCCDLSLSSKFCSPYLLFQPSWGVLDYTQKGNLITAGKGVDNDGGEYSDPCKSDCPTDRCDDEHEIERNREEDEEEEEEDDGVAEEHQMLSDVYERFQRREQEEEEEEVEEADEEEEEEEENCLRSPLNFESKEVEIDEDDEVGTVRIAEQKPIGEDDSNISSDDITIHVCCKEDASLEILLLGMENYADHRLVPVNLIDSITAEDQNLPKYREEDQEKHGDQGVLESESQMETKIDPVVERMSIFGDAVAVLANENEESTRSEELESMEMGENENPSFFNADELNEVLVSEVCELVAIAQATQTLSDDHDCFEVSAAKNSDDLPTFEEDGSQNLGDETKSENLIEKQIFDEEAMDQPLVHKSIPSSEFLQEERSSPNDDEAENSNNSDTFMAENYQDPKQAGEANTDEKSTFDERIEQGINQHLSICSELNDVEEEKVPETPTYVEGLHHLHKKLLLIEKRDSGTEESLDGSVISEFEGGEGVLTIDRLKSALKAEHKALSALYLELEEERSASAIAANQTMAMITRLQEEKAAMQMEALQYQRMMEEQSEYDQEALQLLNELMVKREKEKQELEKEVEIYRKKVLEYESKEKRMMTRRKDCSVRSRTSSGFSSNAEDSDELSIDLNHEVKDEESYCNHQESINNHTPVDAVLDFEDMGLECAKHLSTLDESLADFEEERLSILEQLKALEEKLFTLGDDEEQYFEDIKPIEQYLEEDGKEFNENFEFSSQTNGAVNGFSEDSVGKHFQERRNMAAKAKRLLPLFDAIGMENEDGVFSEEQGGFNTTVSHNSVSKFTLDDKRIAIEEEVDNVYERLQALEADREFLKHCISSLKKGDKGMDLLQEILQHLRDLRNVELRVKNMGDGVQS